MAEAVELRRIGALWIAMPPKETNTDQFGREAASARWRIMASTFD